MDGNSVGSTPKMDWTSRDVPTAWKAFRQHCEFTFGGPLKRKSEEEKCNYLMIWIGDKGRDIYNTWELTAEEAKKLDTYYTKYVKPKSNKLFARYKFHQKVQQEGESFEQFLTDLKLLVKDCGYADPDEMVRDRVVIGCHATKTREKLIQEGSDLTLEKAIDIARTDEMSKAQLKTMTTKNPSINSVNQKKQKSHKKTKSGREKFTSKDCSRCGYQHDKGKCPAQGKRCAKCQKLNHFASVCQSKITVRKGIHYVEEAEDSDEELLVGCITSVNVVDMGEWYEDLRIESKTVKFQLDTGAKANVISDKVVQDLDIECHYEKTLVKLKPYSGHQIPTKGVVTLPCEYKGQVLHVKFHVIEIEAPSVLSAQTCKEMGLLARIHSLQQHNIAERLTDLDQSILAEYPDLFQGLGCLPGEHTIKLDPSVPPVVHPPRKVPVSLKEKIKDELDRTEKAGVIVRQTEPTDWVNNMVAVVKPNKIRICIDPRDLNAAIRREHFPMTTIEEFVASMPQAKVFSVLDATSGYWQVKLDEESSKLCTFNTPFGRYRFTRLPFGIKSAPEVFQNCMSELLADVDGVKVIVDDLLIWGKDDDEHDARLKQVLDQAREVNLKFNAKKCGIRQEEVPYVGHVLSKDGLKPDPEKIRAVQEMKPPQNTKELKTFLGFIQCLGKFMPNMATASAPLRELLEKNIAWHWDQEQEASFERLKQMASSTPVLGYYDPSKPLTLSVDASSKGSGAVLLQDGKPLAYASRALTPTQERYAQIEKETLAIVYGAQKFQQFIYGRPTHVESDHKPLQYILSKPLHQAPLRLQKMMLTLQRYDLKVKYLPGSELSVADALSRSYLQETTETLIPDLEVNEVQLTAHLPISPEKYAEFQKATADDPTMQALRSVVLNGWPGKKEELPGNVCEYWCYRDEISSVDGLLFKAQKLIVPQSMRKEMLDRIHESHQGIVKCKQRARDILFWPGMSSQIEDKVSKCSVCNQFQRAQPREPMIIHEPPDRPWSKIVCGLFEFNGVHYLLSVDYYSKWIEVANLDDITSSNIMSPEESICKVRYP